MNKPLDQAEQRAAGVLPVDPLEGTEPFVDDKAWAPKDGGLKTLEQWGWTKTKPSKRDAIIVRKGGKNDPESDFLLAGKVGMLLAAGGVGKTQALVQLAIAVASGSEFIDGSGLEVVAGGPVLIVCGEEDAEELHRRFYWALEHAKLADGVKIRVTQNVYAMPLAGKPCALQEQPDRFAPPERTATFYELQALIASKPFRLVLLDPLSRFAGPDAETDNRAATSFVEALEGLTLPPKDGTEGGNRPAVIIAHHTNKVSRDEGKAEANASRGSSALTDGMRWVAFLGLAALDKKETDRETWQNRLRLEVVKSNYTKKGWPIEIMREPGGVLRALTKSEGAAEEKAKSAATKKTGNSSRKSVSEPSPVPDLE